MSTQLEPDGPITFAKLPINLEKTNRSPVVVINLPSVSIEVMKSRCLTVRPSKVVSYSGCESRRVR
jgi:hypothetical protein